MLTMAGGSLLVIIFTVALSTSSADSSPNGTQQLQPLRKLSVDPGLAAVHTMANCFLEDVIQRKYLYDLIRPNDTFDDVTKSLNNDRYRWINYWGGFAACIIIGFILSLTMLIVCLVFPCCWMCGRCGGRDPGPRRRRRPCCSVASRVALLVLTIAIFLANLTLYGSNVRLYGQLRGDLLDQVDRGADGISQYLERTAAEVNTTFIGDYLKLRDSVFSLLDTVPGDAFAKLEQATGAQTTLDRLKNFATNQLVTLNASLYDAQVSAAALQVETDGVWRQFEQVKSSVVAKLQSCLTDCQPQIDSMNSTHVNVDFASVNLTAPILAVSLAIDGGFGSLVTDASAQLDRIRQTINSTVASSVQTVKNASRSTETRVRDAVRKVEHDAASYMNMATNFKKDAIDVVRDYLELAGRVIYGLILLFAIIITLIISLNVIGLILGFLKPHRPLMTRRSRCSCYPDRSLGSPFLLTSAALTLLFCWLYALIVLLLFGVGGVAHTEICRHLVHPNEQHSVRVLDLMDHWINGSSATSIQGILPFNTYRQCAKSDSTLYVVLDMGRTLDLENLENDPTLLTAFNDMKAAHISIPNVNVANPNLTRLLDSLDIALRPPAFDVPYVVGRISDEVILPTLQSTVDQLRQLSNTYPTLDLTTEIANLTVLNQTVTQISANRDLLVSHLTSIDVVLRNTNFSSASQTLIRAQDFVTSGQCAVTVGKFVNETADKLYAAIKMYITGSLLKLKTTIGLCRPLYDSIDYVIDAVCIQTVYPVHGIWFSLGWCMALLIPSLAMCAILASMYRYVDDVSHVDKFETESCDMSTINDQNDYTEVDYDTTTRLPRVYKY